MLLAGPATHHWFPVEEQWGHSQLQCVTRRAEWFLRLLWHIYKNQQRGISTSKGSTELTVRYARSWGGLMAKKRLALTTSQAVLWGSALQSWTSSQADFRQAELVPGHQVHQVTDCQTVIIHNLQICNFEHSFVHTLYILSLWQCCNFLYFKFWLHPHISYLGYKCCKTCFCFFMLFSMLRVRFTVYFCKWLFSCVKETYKVRISSA